MPIRFLEVFLAWRGPGQPLPQQVGVSEELEVVVRLALILISLVSRLRNGLREPIRGFGGLVLSHGPAVATREGR